jgi:membrane-bound lytic murein transglycosylase MltF
MIVTLGLVFLGANLLKNSAGGATSNPYSETAWRKFDGMFKKHAGTYGLDWMWLKAICLNESSLGTYPSVALGLREPSNISGSKSQDGKSWGIMQVTLTTARDLDSTATERKLNDPDYSIRLAALYLNRVKTMFLTIDPRFEEWVIKSYNQGPGNSKKEKAGESKGFAGEYWERYKRNLALVKARP